MNSHNRSKRINPNQGDLFGADEIADIYKARPDQPIDNATLYRLAAKRAGLNESELNTRVPIGRSGQRHSLERRAIRWKQQDLRRAGILERVPGERGIWRLTEDAKRGLHMAKPGVKVLGFKTDLGVAVFGGSEDIFRSLDVEPVAIICSPPYPLSHQRAYGNPSQAEIVKFIMGILEPIIEKLSEAGSIALNVSNDIFMPNSPARSTYIERLTIALEDAGLSLIDRIVWKSNKPPGPVAWASMTRQVLNVAYEPILLFAKNPHRFKGDNRRVLEPHTDRHLALMAGGGEKRYASIHGSLDEQIRKHLAQSWELMLIYQHSRQRGYVAFQARCMALVAELEQRGIDRPECGLTRGAGGTGWRVADVEMALFAWALDANKDRGTRKNA